MARAAPLPPRRTRAMLTVRPRGARPIRARGKGGARGAAGARRGERVMRGGAGPGGRRVPAPLKRQQQRFAPGLLRHCRHKAPLRNLQGLPRMRVPGPAAPPTPGRGTGACDRDEPLGLPQIPTALSPHQPLVLTINSPLTRLYLGRDRARPPPPL